MINFDRPELSPILDGLEKKNSAAYKEGLEILQRSRDQLKEKSRADMPNFVACEVDLNRKKKYDRLQDYQLRVKKAIRNGERIYDRDLDH